MSRCVGSYKAHGIASTDMMWSTAVAKHPYVLKKSWNTQTNYSSKILRSRLLFPKLQLIETENIWFCSRSGCINHFPMWNFRRILKFDELYTSVSYSFSKMSSSNDCWWSLIYFGIVITRISWILSEPAALHGKKKKKTHTFNETRIF